MTFKKLIVRFIDLLEPARHHYVLKRWTNHARKLDIIMSDALTTRVVKLPNAIDSRSYYYVTSTEEIFNRMNKEDGHVCRGEVILVERRPAVAHDLSAPIEGIRNALYEFHCSSSNSGELNLYIAHALAAEKKNSLSVSTEKIS